MIAGKNCGNCAAFSALTRECRRKSPIPVMVQGPDGKPGSLGVYPATDKDGWCAEWLTDEKTALQ